MVVLMTVLATVTRFKVSSNYGIHALPVGTLKQSLFGSVDTIVTSQEGAVGIDKDFWDKEKNNSMDRHKLLLDTAQNDVTLNKTICKKGLWEIDIWHCEAAPG